MGLHDEGAALLCALVCANQSFGANLTWGLSVAIHRSLPSLRWRPEVVSTQHDILSLTHSHTEGIVILTIILKESGIWSKLFLHFICIFELI